MVPGTDRYETSQTTCNGLKLPAADSSIGPYAQVVLVIELLLATDKSDVLLFKQVQEIEEVLGTARGAVQAVDHYRLHIGSGQLEIELLPGRTILL